MDTKKNCAERMRPILQAMERSIESARRNRTKQPFAGPKPVFNSITPAPIPQPKPVMSIPSTIQESPIIREMPKQHDTSSDQSNRLKARPKRLEAPLTNPFEQPAYRSRAS